METVRTTGGYDGSVDTLTSTASQELIPQPIQNVSINGFVQLTSPYKNSEWQSKTYFEQFYFYNDAAVHVKVNGEKTIYLRAGQNFEVEKGDPAISSFIVLDAGITFTWGGIYV